MVCTRGFSLSFPAILTFKPVQVVRIAEEVHWFKTNNLGEAVIRSSKDLEKVFATAVEDSQALHSFFGDIHR